MVPSLPQASRWSSLGSALHVFVGMLEGHSWPLLRGKCKQPEGRSSATTCAEQKGVEFCGPLRLCLHDGGEEGPEGREGLSEAMELWTTARDQRDAAEAKLLQQRAMRLELLQRQVTTTIMLKLGVEKFGVEFP